jgi:hypothetical protein
VRVRTIGVTLLVFGLGAATSAAHGFARSAGSLTVPRSLVGCWSRHVPALPVGTSAGVWLIRIQSSGAFAAYTPGSTKCGTASDFTSHVSVSSGRLTVGHVPICATNGVYSVKPARNSFVLRTLSDRSCSVRVGLLAGTWKRES